MISSFFIQKFRNISSLELQDLRGTNLILGPNGVGKTSILEALYFLSLARSFRTHSFKKVIQKEAEHLLVHGCLTDDCKLGVQKNSDGKLTVRIDGETHQGIAECTLKLPVQVIDPEAFRLLQDGPEERRRFVDWGVYQKYPSFYQYWRDYQRLLKQRNAAIRSQMPSDMVQLWDEQMVQATLSIDELRRSYLQEFQQYFEQYIQVLLPHIEVKLSYYAGWTDGVDYAEILSDRLLKDMELGYTYAGPHRFDLKIKTEGGFAADIFSRGQQKLTVIAMKLAQASLCCQDKKLVFLLDDIAAELDEEKRTLLAHLLRELECQTFITGVEKQLLTPFQNEDSLEIYPEKLLD